MASRSSKPKYGTPSFFKILLDPSASNLPLPPAFVRRHFKDEIPKYPTLKTSSGEHSWQLKIKQIDGNYCFATGWDKVVKDAHLGFGDFLVVWLIDDSTFQASIYGPNGCEKVLSPNFTKCKRNGDTSSALPEKKEIKIEDDEIEIEIVEKKVEEDVVKKSSTVDNSPEEQHPFFQILISDTNKHNQIMRLPRRFVAEAKLERKKTILLMDLEGTEWPMSIHCEKDTRRQRMSTHCEKDTRRESCRYYLSSGWREFREHNELLDGDLCLFKFIKREGLLMLAQVIKNRAMPGNAHVIKNKAMPRNAQVIKNKAIPRNTGSLDQKSPHYSTPSSEVVKRKRGRPRLYKEPCFLADVKTEDVSTPEEEAVKRETGMPPLTKSPKVVYF